MASVSHLGEFCSKSFRHLERKSKPKRQICLLLDGQASFMQRMKNVRFMDREEFIEAIRE